MDSSLNPHAARPLMLAIGLIVSIGIHASVLTWVQGVKTTAPHRVLPTELQIVQLDPPARPTPIAPPSAKRSLRAASKASARPIAEAAQPAIEAAQPSAEPAAEAPLFIPGFRLNAGPPQSAPAAEAKPRPGDLPPGTADREPAVAAEHEIPYPEEARRAGIEGVVRLRITVAATGRVTEAKVLRGPGHGLNEAARDAILKFTFTPAMKAGAPVSTSMIYQYTFELR